LYFYALFSLSSLLVGVVSRFSFSSVCVRGPVCTFFVFFFSFFFFFFLQCQHHERRPTDRQSTTTCFAQLKESNGSSGNSSKTRNNNGSNNFSFNLQYNIVSLLFVLCACVCVYFFFLSIYPISSIHPSIVIIIIIQYLSKNNFISNNIYINDEY
jgi:hypothetical protein